MFAKLQLVTAHEAAARGRCTGAEVRTRQQRESSRIRLHEAKMISDSPRCCLIGLQYRCVLQGINLKTVIAAEEPRQRLEQRRGASKSQLVLHHTRPLLCFLAYGHVHVAVARWRSCVRSCAIKKAQGAKGGREESRERRGRAAAEEASVFPQERGCRAKSTWKSQRMGKWCRARVLDPAPRLPGPGGEPRPRRHGTPPSWRFHVILCGARSGPEEPSSHTHTHTHAPSVQLLATCGCDVTC